jgi:hypothetical protein
METDDIIKKFAELSQEKLQDDTIKLLETMPEQELWNVLIQTRYKEQQLFEQLKKIDNEADSLVEMESYLKVVFEKRLMINTDTLLVQFEDEE